MGLGIFAEHFQNEDAARAHLEAKMWPNGPFCPPCRSVRVFTDYRADEQRF
jgi:hypothetical protein